MKIVRCNPANLRPNDILLRRNQLGRYEIVGTVVRIPVAKLEEGVILVELDQMSMHIEGDNTLSEPSVSVETFKVSNTEPEFAYVLRKDMYWSTREYELQLRNMPPEAFRQLYEGQFFSPEIKTERGRYTPPKTDKG